MSSKPKTTLPNCYFPEFRNWDSDENCSEI